MPDADLERSVENDAQSLAQPDRAGAGAPSARRRLTLFVRHHVWSSQLNSDRDVLRATAEA